MHLQCIYIPCFTLQRPNAPAAVKYGTKQRARTSSQTGATRWKYTYANIVYITDESSTREITSYAQPIDIPRAALSIEHIGEHEAAKERLRRHPSLCTSHTVIVVDHSASMRTSDVFDFRNRAKAVFGMLALDFVAKQRLSGEATNTDVVSLVLMHDWVEVLFEREPMGLVLYNKFVGLHDQVRPRSHGNFLPSLNQAEELLRTNNGGAALCLLFLSDGKPSDNATGIFRGNNIATTGAISDRMSLLAASFRHRLTVATLGFANRDQDFSVLEAMAKAARTAGAKGEFHRPELSSVGLGSAIARSVSSLTATKSKLSTVLAPPKPSGHRPLPVLREVERECAASWDSWMVASSTSQTEDGWVIYTDNVNRFEFSPVSVRGLEVHPWVAKNFYSNKANGIVIRRKAFGEGAERLVFGMQEFDSRTGDMVGPELVAKESKQVGFDDQTSSFHDTFANTQATAMKIATRFNMLVRERLSVFDAPNDGADRRVWAVSFLSCSVYSFIEEGVERFVLAEKRLMPAHRYTKWNGNNGYVFHRRGQIARKPAAGPATEQALKARAEELMETVLADDDDDYDSGNEGSTGSMEPEDVVDYGAGADVYNRGMAGLAGSRKRGREEIPVYFSPRPDDYLQAFSHFSYWNSSRKMLVCDLQGVMSLNELSDNACAGVFELTDPVIHYSSQSGRKQVYGRTDLGKKGMHRFFQTHDCNDVCRLLGLPGCRSPAAMAAEAAAVTAADSCKRRMTRQFALVP